MFSLKTAILGAIITVGGAIAGHAQIAQGSAIFFEVPNSFVVAGETLSPGSYTISRPPTSSGSRNLLMVRGNHGQAALFTTVGADSGKESNETEVIFYDVNGTYYLAGFKVKGWMGTNELRLRHSVREAIAARPAPVVYINASQTGY